MLILLLLFLSALLFIHLNKSNTFVFSLTFQTTLNLIKMAFNIFLISWKGKISLMLQYFYMSDFYENILAFQILTFLNFPGFLFVFCLLYYIIMLKMKISNTRSALKFRLH